MSPNENASDPILDELHAVRAQMLDEAGGTLQGVVEALRRHEAERRSRGGTPVVIDLGVEWPTSDSKLPGTTAGQ
jgi:hypothetical protein